MNKRGVFFLIDALVAIGILVVALILVLSLSAPTNAGIETELLVLDSFMTTLSTTRLQDLDNPSVNELINQSLLSPTTTALDGVAELYRKNMTGELSLEYARNLTRTLATTLQNQTRYGFYYVINDTMLYNQSFAQINDSSKRVTLNRMTFFSYRDGSTIELFGPVNTEVSLWITS